MFRKGILIGIAGASGSGKTLVAQTLVEQLDSNQVLIIQEDAYYHDLSHLPFEDRMKYNFDHPKAFDHNLLNTQLKQLLLGRAIEQPLYDYTTHCRKQETQAVEPHEIIILEGILLLTIPRLRKIMDIRIYVDTPADICFIRRLQRDLNERKRDIKSIIKQYLETVRPMFLQYVVPSREYADIIIPHGGKNFVAIDIIKSKIEMLLNSR